ncbi:MAG TPA: hypothetical protein PLL09_04030 [Flavobacterium sp.]|uniref:hypothetical protein n=1 Tax=unclassified Flavobacterium TaxID=196869 RepID=UPI000E8284FF|nr:MULTISPECIES: hypothetical protein [unclassified Flavobacterium]HBI01335.1 hypothetical protein [Flavobacterium sp.]HRE76975.1 hypothetical protein [Flavobacterium sp.]
MKKLNQNELLDQKIALLTIQHRQELVEIKEQFKLVQESISPSNIIQEGLQGVYQTVTDKNKLLPMLPTLLSLVGGYVSKKVIIGNSSNPIKKVLGTVLQFVVTNYLTKVNSKEETVSETEEPELNKL